MKQKYYSIDNLISKKAIYNILLGERSNGKSYATKKLCLWEAYHEKDFKTGKQKKRYQFGYLRRWREEIKSRDVELYFADMPIDEFSDGLVFDVEHAKKTLMSYEDDMQPIVWNKGQYDELYSTYKYGICALPTTYSLGITEEFNEFVTMLQNGRTETEIFRNETKILFD